MRLIRIINVVHYDHRKQRFASLAFKNSTGGGISVISQECILEQGRTVCHHIKTFYPPPTSSEPAIFWALEENSLPTGYRLEQQPSTSSDICHYNIEGVADKSARALMIRCQLHEFQICENGTSHTLTTPE